MATKAAVREALGIDPGLLAIDPAGCGCTECLIGQYLPLDRAEPKHIFAMALGLLRNNTDYPDPAPVTSIEFAYRTWTLEDL